MQKQPSFNLVKVSRALSLRREHKNVIPKEELRAWMSSLEELDKNLRVRYERRHRPALLEYKLKQASEDLSKVKQICDGRTSELQNALSELTANRTKMNQERQKYFQLHKDLEAQVKEMKDQLQESEAKLIVKTHEFEEKLKEKDNEFQQKWESERQEQEKLKDTVENLESEYLEEISELNARIVNLQMEQESKENNEEEMINPPQRNASEYTIRSSECRICFEADRAKDSLPCGHFLCEECCLQHVHQRRTCPFCRAPTNPTDIRRLFDS
ncbi:Oidioi.mRNA.OKI2018_I69.chr1.g2228.t1.cds [Oikopleura dioica]|uniref:Oidioi.mRNA.OKI2018_I69.chr1.g2228.t1.cds n=1 Tax=Oikopleura dioica TaxID=34765 RepID=A0ABN7SXD0_OIKDI|nr:Oidioi.mRNA.OKI2018_I69.chr1.g2228.t1.cds [Oikopleura dioica]